MKKRRVRDSYQSLSPVPDVLPRGASLREVIEAIARYKSTRSVFIVDPDFGLRA